MGMRSKRHKLSPPLSSCVPRTTRQAQCSQEASEGPALPGKVAVCQLGRVWESMSLEALGLHIMSGRLREVKPWTQHKKIYQSNEGSSVKWEHYSCVKGEDAPAAGLGRRRVPRK